MIWGLVAPRLALAVFLTGWVAGPYIDSYFADLDAVDTPYSE